MFGAAQMALRTDRAHPVAVRLTRPRSERRNQTERSGNSFPNNFRDFLAKIACVARIALDSVHRRRGAPSAATFGAVAEHSGNLHARSEASILHTEPLWTHAQPLALGRVTILGLCTKVSVDERPSPDLPGHDGLPICPHDFFSRACSELLLAEYIR
jgi:hypothetical protein